MTAAMTTPSFGFFGVVKRRATAFTPMPMRIAKASVRRGMARPVLRSASPAAELFAQCLNNAPSGVGDVYGYAPTAITTPTNASTRKYAR